MKHLLALLLTATPALAQKAPECGAFQDTGANLVCECAAGDAGGSVWGDGPYTGDSDICTAAVHAGVLGPNGGRVIVEPRPGQESYQGSTANGITTGSWQAYPNSFDFANASAEGGEVACRRLNVDEASLTCHCPPDAEGTVWGSDPYTADSATCAAARHAGAIPVEGGEVTVYAAPGEPSYEGSAANGITSLGWAAYGASITFEAPDPAP